MSLDIYTFTYLYYIPKCFVKQLSCEVMENFKESMIQLAVLQTSSFEYKLYFYKNQLILPRLVASNFLAASASICSQFVLISVRGLTDEKSKQKDKTKKNNTDRLYKCFI